MSGCQKSIISGVYVATGQSHQHHFMLRGNRCEQPDRSWDKEIVHKGASRDLPKRVKFRCKDEFIQNDYPEKLLSTTHNTTKVADVTSDVTAHKTTQAADVTNDVTTHRTTQAADMTSDVTTNKTTQAADMINDVTTHKTNQAAVVTSNVTTHKTTHAADVISDVTTPRTIQAAGVNADVNDAPRLEENMYRFLRDVRRRRERQLGSKTKRKTQRTVSPNKLEKALSDISSVSSGHGVIVRPDASRTHHDRTKAYPAVPRVNDLVGDKLLIKGLVVDAASNQQPSVVRASKYANLREEYALRQRVEGYRFTCHQNLTNLNVAQRRLSINLAQLKNKMAAYGLQTNAENRTIQPAVHKLNTEMFLRNKGYVAVVDKASNAYCFPPLTYPKRRLLTVN